MHPRRRLDGQRDRLHLTCTHAGRHGLVTARDLRACRPRPSHRVAACARRPASTAMTDAIQPASPCGIFGVFLVVLGAGVILDADWHRVGPRVDGRRHRGVFEWRRKPTRRAHDMNRTTRTSIGIAISVVALYLAMPPREEWGNVAAAFARVRYAYLVPIALMSAYSVVVRCQRWQLLLRPVGTIPFMPLFSATSIGFLCNMVLPLRVGEVIRPVLLANRTPCPREQRAWLRYCSSACSTC